MTTIAELFALAWQNQQAGNFGQAELLYRQVLQAEPAHAEAWARLGSVCARQGRNTEAIDSYSQALKLRPERVQTHYNLGIVLHSQGRSQEALVCFQHAIRLSPTLAQPHFSLGHVLQEQGRLDEAMAAYREALRLNPQYAEVHNNIAIARESQGRLEEAVASFHQALRLNPNFAAAHTNLGLTLQRQGRLEEALPLHQQALRLDPNSYTANYNLGFAFQEQGNYDQATACLQQALRLRPSAKLRIALATRLPLIYQSMTELQSWRNRLIQEVRQLREQQVVHDLTEEPGLNLLFYLAYQGLNDRDLQREFAHLHRAPELPVASARHLSDPENRKIRVGFLSSFFCEHTIGHLMGGLVAKLSRADFDVTVLSVGCREDATVGFFKQHADCYLQVPRHLSTARRLIAEQHLDVLFYTDIGMDTFTTALAFSRLAPVQCATWGHPVTTGIDTIDYFISSEHLETDQAEQHYTESLVRLKNLPVHYFRPALPLPHKAREDFGLAVEAHIYACPQSLFKLHPEFDDLLGGILRGDPRGTLVLSQGAGPHVTQQLRKRFATTLPDVVDRIHFVAKLKRPDFLSLLAVADVLLDPLHFGGGNTSYEGLAFGVPIVTLPSQFLRGRITFALYQQMQMLDCVARSPLEYVEIALRLGTDDSYRQTIRDKILAAHSVLLENSEGVRELEQFFKGACLQSSSPPAG